MKQVVFAATFRGNAAPANDAGTQLSVRGSASELVALDGPLPAGLGPHAEFQSTADMGENGSFHEFGTIDLGAGNTIQFREVQPGLMAPAPGGGMAGTVDWKVESGTGIFTGAAGLITSNFSVGDDGNVVDRHLAVIDCQD